jgi:CopG family transcriptional regulator / antitoxin EndoAI
MSKRINIVLPESTIRTLDRIVKRGGRSRFIDEAIRHFLEHKSAEALRFYLERAAIWDRDLDQEVAADWFAVDIEARQRLDIAKGER